MKLDEIRGMSDADLRGRVTELEEERFRLRFRGATETLEDPLRLRTVRRDIARVLTVLRERELGAAKGATTGATKGAAKGAAKGATKGATKGASKTTSKTASKGATKKSATAAGGTRGGRKTTAKTAR